jgi:hypothetical protein
MTKVYWGFSSVELALTENDAYVVFSEKKKT